MTTADSIFGVIQPKPIYRTKGRFRKETPDEFRGRYDDAAWRFYVQEQYFRKKMVEAIAGPNPYEQLLAK